MNRPYPERIVIVGGGTAGWSAAACLSQFLKNTDTQIILVESSKIATVGVGEASIPNLRNFNAYVGLDDLSFIQKTKATFKLGIQFKHWKDGKDSFFHPFGAYGADMMDASFYDCFLKARQTKPDLDLQDYSLSTQIALQDRFAQPAPAQSAISDFGYAYHFDATLYAESLKHLALERGVESMDDLVIDVHLKSESGEIKNLKLESGRTLQADFFIDCSGFRALLIEGALKTGYESWKHWLPCDRAVAMKCHPKNRKSLKPYTVATAQSHGWSWRIPLQDLVGNGYVYCSEFTTDHLAEEILSAQMESSPLSAPNYQKFTAGMRKQFWSKNCVSLGLASGFIEPLESTSINLVHRALSILMEYFPGNNNCLTLSQEANLQFQKEQIRIRDFIILHYKLSSRRDSDFWRYVTAMDIPESLSRKIDTFKANGKVLSHDFESFEPASWITLFEGLGVKPHALNRRIEDLEQNSIINNLERMKIGLLRSAATASPHGEFLNNILRKH